MARYVETKITLSANQAAGTATILAADGGATGVGTRSSVIFGNPTAKDFNLHLTTGQADGSGLPFKAGTLNAFDRNLSGLDNEVYLTGAAAGDKITIWTA